ncbi:MAG: hypothetical protein H5T59_12755, partial [Anaerolineae bacterium]|nr:hypothetical protein [Anaerolineae bacterium]
MTDPLRLSREVVACNYAAGLRFLRPPGQVPCIASPVALEPDGPGEVGQWGTWTLTCTLPEGGLSPAGALRCYVGNPLGASPSFQRLQGDDPAGEGFVTAWAGPRRLRVGTDLIGPGGLPLGNVIQVRAEGGPVPGGTEVRLVLGDRSQGGPGARLPPYDGPVGFWCSLDAAGDGRWADWADVPVLQVRSGPLASLRLVVPSLAVAGRQFRATLQGFDALGNPAPLQGTFVVSEAGRVLRCVAVPAGAGGLPQATFPLALEEVGVHRLQVRGEGLSGEGNPVEVLAQSPAWGLFWGEIHGHSWLSDGTADPEAYFRYGREVACLDFCALTDHDTWLTPEKWAIIRHVVQAHHRPREFVTLLGFEWSSGQFWTAPGRRFGHKNVYYVGETGPFFSHLDPRYDTPAKLWAALGPAQSITIAHHPAYPRDEFPCWGTDWT